MIKRSRPLSALIFLTGGDHWIGGVQYTRNLLRAMQTLPSSERPKLILRLSHEHIKSGYQHEFSNLAGVELDRETFSSILNRWVKGFFGVKVASCRLGDLCDVAYPVKGPGLALKPQPIHWIPDFQFKYYPDFFPEKEREARNIMYDKMFDEGKLFVFISKRVEDDFRRFFPQASHILSRVLTFPSIMLPEELSPNPISTVKKYGLPERYVYLPNQFWQHKGHDTAIEALHLLKQEGVEIPLVCTGNTDDYRSKSYFLELKSRMEEFGLTAQIKIMGILPRIDQLQIFRCASFIVQPSRFEGWSTPVEDARALGKPIILSNLDVHQDQNPPYCEFFKVGNSTDLADKIRKAWLSIQEGFSPEKEAKAQKESFVLAQQYARNFIAILEEAKALAKSK